MIISSCHPLPMPYLITTLYLSLSTFLVRTKGHVSPQGRIIIVTPSSEHDADPPNRIAPPVGPCVPNLFLPGLTPILIRFSRVWLQQTHGPRNKSVSRCVYVCVYYHVKNCEWIHMMDSNSVLGLVTSCSTQSNHIYSLINFREQYYCDTYCCSGERR
jgi:hypothetical protein